MAKKLFRAFVSALGLVILFSGQVLAQSQPEEPTYWGVTSNLIPSWEFVPEIKKLFHANDIDLKGSEFKIGFVRGKEFGGDWGVSLIRKKISDSKIDVIGEICFRRGVYPNQHVACFKDGDVYFINNVYLTGVEAHKFVSFATIKDRVQIGMNFAAGLGTFQGEVEKHTFWVRQNYVFPNPVQRSQEEKIENVSANKAWEELGGKWPVSPLGKIELAVAGILTPGLKVKVSGGLNSWGVQRFSLGVTYFFGVKRADAPIIAGRE